MATRVSFHPERELDEALALIHDDAPPPPDLGGREPAWPDFPRAEHAARYGRLAALLDAYDLDALVLTQEETIRTSAILPGSSGPSGGAAACMVATRDPRDALLIRSAFRRRGGEGTSWVGTVDGHPDPMAIPGKVADPLRRLALRPDRVGMETARAPSSRCRGRRRRRWSTRSVARRSTRPA